MKNRIPDLTLAKAHPDILAAAGGIQALASLRSKLARVDASISAGTPVVDRELENLLEFVTMVQTVADGKGENLYFKVHDLGEDEIAVTCAGAKSVLHAAAVLFLRYFSGREK